MQLKIKKLFYRNLQQNQEIHKDEEWHENMIEIENRVSEIEEYRNIDFFITLY